MEVLSALIGAVIGGVLTIAGAWAQAAYYRRARRNHLKSSLAAEIGSLVALGRIHDYEGHLRQAAQLAEATPEGEKREVIAILADHNYLSVFEANAAEIGLLDSALAARVIGFYQVTRSWLDTVSRTNVAHLERLTGQQAAAAYRLLADRISKLGAFGDDLVIELGGQKTISDEMAKVKALIE
jgi:hypothetical protein